MMKCVSVCLYRFYLFPRSSAGANCGLIGWLVVILMTIMMRTMMMMLFKIIMMMMAVMMFWLHLCRWASTTHGISPAAGRRWPYLYLYIISYIISHNFVLIYYISIFILSPRGAGDQIFFPEPEIQSKLKGRDGKRISTLIHMHFCRRGNGMENL